MAGLISIGLTGLLSHQSALSTTGNNVTNANTPGYSRQQTVFDALPSQYSGAGFVGAGVAVADVQRLNNEFVNQQLRSDTTLNAGQSAMSSELARLDNLFGSESTGLNTVLGDFFAALQDSAEAPDSTPQRQLLISRGEALAQRFQTLSARLEEQGASIEDQLAAETSKINSLASSIADLNLKISSSPGLARGIQPNELLDQRDEKLRQLSESIQIQVNHQADGQVDVYLGKGQTLVSKDQANTLSLEADPDNPKQSNIVLDSGASTRRIGGEVSGGRLGALLDFRDQALRPAQNQLGRIALGVAAEVNGQHRQGVDLEGSLGGDFFADINSASALANRVTPNADNQSAAQIGLEITDMSKLKAEDYVLEFIDAETYALRRVSDGAPIIGEGRIADLEAATSEYGFRLQIPDGAAFAPGDRFRLNPTNAGAADIAMAVARPEAIALASPLKAQAAQGNTGSGRIDQGSVADTTKLGSPGEPFSVDLVVEIKPKNEQGIHLYDVYENGSTTPLAEGPFEIGPQGSLLGNLGARDYGFQFQITGNPDVGDRFSISSNTGNSSDNRNALALGDISRLGLMDGGESTLDEAYGLLVSDIGIETSRAQSGLEASSTLLEQSSNSWQQQSGVNLDEEAGKLVQYQAAYNASAQVVSVARDLFNTLLGTFR